MAMLNKIGFILLVLAFGALVFGAGALAPESVKAPLAAATAALDALKKVAPASNAEAESGAAAPTDTAAATPAADGAATGEAAAAATKPAPIPYRDLVVPSPAPPNAEYAVQVALVADAAEADALAARVKALGYPVKVLEVQAAPGVAWRLVAAGRYPSAAEADAAALVLARDLGFTDRLPPVVLPPPPAPAGG
jgi:cell division septation protein DedD